MSQNESFDSEKMYQRGENGVVHKNVIPLPSSTNWEKDKKREENEEKKTKGKESPSV